MDERVGQPEELRNTSFGERLRHLRHLRRLRVRSEGGTPLLDDVAEYARMAGCLAGHGYAIAPDDYGEVEAGERLPEDPIAFLAAVSQCLVLTQSEWRGLFGQLGYDILRQAAGADLADEMVSAKHA